MTTIDRQLQSIGHRCFRKLLRKTAGRRGGEIWHSRPASLRFRRSGRLARRHWQRARARFGNWLGKAGPRRRWRWWRERRELAWERLAASGCRKGVRRAAMRSVASSRSPGVLRLRSGRPERPPDSPESGHRRARLEFGLMRPNSRFSVQFHEFRPPGSPVQRVSGPSGYSATPGM